jgi:hypothetical protein
MFDAVVFGKFHKKKSKQKLAQALKSDEMYLEIQPNW